MKREHQESVLALIDLSDDVMKMIVAFVACYKCYTCRLICADINEVRVCLTIGSINRQYRIMGERLLGAVDDYDDKYFQIYQKQLNRMYGLRLLRISGSPNINNIGHLKYLHTLTMSSFCNITLPTTLTSLNLSSNPTVVDISHLTALTYLSNLSNNINTLCTLTNLCVLKLGQNRTMSDLTQNTALTSLDLGRNRYIKHISHLTRLVKLKTSDQMIDVSSLTRLESLAIYNHIQNISMLTNLRTLTMASNEYIKDLSMLTNLTRLNLWNNHTVDLATIPCTLKEFFYRGRHYPPGLDEMKERIKGCTFPGGIYL